MDNFVHYLILMLENFSPEILSLITFLICAITILGMLRYFGATGLYVYNAIAIIVANIQVLHAAKFIFSPEPVALGTVVFATTYLVSDILTEHYGPDTAKHALWLSFVSQVLVTLLMILTLGHTPLSEGVNPPEVNVLANANYLAMLKLFTPTPRLLFASLIAYVLSQLFDIWIFQKIRNLSHGRYIWLRQNVSTFLSGLLDSFIFSYIAWILLSPTPLPFYTLMVSYVIGTYLLRLIVNLLGTPVMYASYRV
jgi:queuosine precursor transporter